ncbi:MAG TPA: hypothetical protein VKL99_16485 [Candidatus Angelobacter sp.]|nr:MAG: hypothetical protein DMG65_04370 [Candidatus Angelobacter sp. Gp1-AA117]HMC32435.1 hypothetical protein [Candidatus Angelobacter sp.]
MEYQRQLILLESAEKFGGRPPVEFCGQVFRRLHPVMASSVRMAFEGRSTASGEQPRWLKRAADVRVLGFSDHRGNTMLELEAQRLGDAAEEIYKQRRLWNDLPAPEETAVNVMARVVHDIRMANAESQVYDSALLRVTQHLEPLFAHDLSAIRLPEAPNDTQLREVLDRDVPIHARQLCNSTPPPRQIRLAGTLDMIRYSTRAFALKLAEGKEIQGVLDREDMIEPLSPLLNKKIVIVGKAVYRPSGSVLRIDVQYVEQDSGEPTLFSRVPPPIARKPFINKIRTETAKAGIDAFFGIWPGDETDEELLGYVKELRG